MRHLIRGNFQLFAPDQREASVSPDLKWIITSPPTEACWILPEFRNFSSLAMSGSQVSWMPIRTCRHCGSYTCPLARHFVHHAAMTTVFTSMCGIRFLSSNLSQYHHPLPLIIPPGRQHCYTLHISVPMTQWCGNLYLGVKHIIHTPPSIHLLGCKAGKPYLQAAWLGSQGVATVYLA